jgi:hypothetical protein
MDIGFDEALRIARKSIGDMTSDQSAVIQKFESGNDYFFEFQTSKGRFELRMERNGWISKISRQEKDAIDPSNGPEKGSQTKGNHYEGKDHHDDHDYKGRNNSQSANYRPVSGQRIQQSAAVEKALAHVGGGKVENIKPSGDGFEIDINRGLMKGRMKVYVDGNGTVNAQKQSRMGDLMDFELD